MVDFKQIYETQAAAYDRMVRYEDYQKNINRVLLSKMGDSTPTILELGAGTGRLTRIIAPHTPQLVACDASLHMLSFAKQQMSAAHCRFVVADNRQLPFKSAEADTILAGWSLGHSVGWYPQRWQEEITKVLQEIKRVLLPGGLVMIFETLGTGTNTPQPPTAGLAQFYHWLESQHHFQREVISTDYRFPTVDEADHSTRFFFGDALADHIQQQQLTILPEFTGLWWRRF